MDKKTRNRFEARAEILKAMAHPSRLFMLDRLSDGEKCVCELTEMVGADMSTVSKHLSVLKNAGIISARKQGTQIFYRLKCKCIMKFIGCIETVVENAAREQLDSVK